MTDDPLGKRMAARRADGSQTIVNGLHDLTEWRPPPSVMPASARPADPRRLIRSSNAFVFAQVGTDRQQGDAG
jgi:hypothetical protein